MKLPYSLIMLFGSWLGYKSDIKTRPEKLKLDSVLVSFYDFKATSLEGDTIDFAKYRGKKVLIVNTASECGYTPQYEQLETLHEKYKDTLVVLGFPCDQFGGQEPGNNQEIQGFCKRNYGVTFQMFEKIEVKGENQHPLYKWLTSKELNGWNSQEPQWNFSKYLINEKGELLRYYASSVSPLSKEIIRLIEK